VKYSLHPQAAAEHEDQVAYYETRAEGLGRRYHAALRATLVRICDGPQRFRLVHAPDVRRAALKDFPFAVFFRPVDDAVQILAVAANRKRPNYWKQRI
jgi:toxin ParE1/3/4